MTTDATLKTIGVARRSFETTIGKQVINATQADIENWLHLLRDQGLAANTCRTYLSIVNQFTLEADVNMPRRAPTVKRTLSVEEITFLLHVATAENYSWLAVCLLAGPESLAWTWGRLYDANFIVPMEAYLLLMDEAERRGFELFPQAYRGNEDAHWVGGGCDRSALIWNIPQHAINRRLKSMARKAGIKVTNMNITTLRYTHNALIAQYANSEKTAKALNIHPAKKQVLKPSRKNPHLYQLGRRSPAFIDRA